MSRARVFILASNALAADSGFASGVMQLVPVSAVSTEAITSALKQATGKARQVDTEPGQALCILLSGGALNRTRDRNGNMESSLGCMLVRIVPPRFCGPREGAGRLFRNRSGGEYSCLHRSGASLWVSGDHFGNYLCVFRLHCDPADNRGSKGIKGK